MDKERKEFIESLNNDDLEMTSSFKDIMSRRELKRHQKEKEASEPKDSFNIKPQEKLEITNSFDEIISKKDKKRLEKEKKELAKQKELQQQQLLKDQAAALEKRKETEIKYQKEQKKLQKKESKNSSNFNSPFLNFILIIILLCSIGYFIYNFFFNKSDPNQLYLLFNSASITFLTLLFTFAIKAKRQPFKGILQVFTSILLLIYIVGTVLININVLKFPNKVTIENFANKNIAEAMQWAEENDIDLNINYDFSDAIEKNLIISQSVEPNTLASKINNLEVVVSNGPNYDLKVAVPYMVDWHIDEVVETIEELKLNNVNIDYEFSDTTDRDLAYEQSQDGEMTRNTEINMKFSLGPEAELKPVKLKDLKNETEFMATLWLKRNGIKYEIKYSYSEKVEYGKVISTSPKAKTTIDQTKDKVELNISKGKKIIAPDLTKMSLTEIVNWAKENDLNITYDSEYDDSIRSGKVKRASVKKGDIVDQGKTIHVIMSKGKLKMIEYDSDDLDKIRRFAEQNNISLEVTEEYNDLEKGKLIDVSHKAGQLIKNSDIIKITVSKGKATKIPNFIGLTINEAKKQCSSNNLSCNYDYAYSTDTKNTVIYQNKTSGTEVIEGSSITLTISNGPAPSGQNNYTPPTSSGNSSTGGNSGTNTPTPSEPTCISKQIIIERNINNEFNNYSGYAAVSAALYSYFAALDVNVNVVGVPDTGMASGQYVGGIGPGSVVETCGKTYTIQIAI